jgi:hypothetical protein
MRVKAHQSREARPAKDRMLSCPRTSAGCFGSDWALGITFAASGHQRTSPAKVRDTMHSAGDFKKSAT